MIINTETGRSVDTDRDLGPAERHVLQKLFLWQSMASSLEEFREKKTTALQKGWNGSGAINASPALKTIINDLEKKLLARLRSDGS